MFMIDKGMWQNWHYFLSPEKSSKYVTENPSFGSLLVRESDLEPIVNSSPIDRVLGSSGNLSIEPLLLVLQALIGLFSIRRCFSRSSSSSSGGRSSSSNSSGNFNHKMFSCNGGTVSRSLLPSKFYDLSCASLLCTFSTHSPAISIENSSQEEKSLICPGGPFYGARH